MGSYPRAKCFSAGCAVRRPEFASLLSVIAFLLASPAYAGGGDSGAMAMAANGQAPGRSIKLEGRAEVEAAVTDPNAGFKAWRAANAYRYAAAALNANEFKIAAQWFKVAGDDFEASVGEGKQLAEARFAQAQAARLAKLDDEANKCFEIAVKLFKKYDPTNPYLKAGQGFLDKVSKPTSAPLQASVTKTALQATVAKAAVKFQAMEGKIDNVGKVVLKGKVGDGSFKLAALKDGDYFGGAHFQSEAAAVDVGDKYVKDAVYKGFVKMTCLEFAALGGNYYTAPDNYKSLKSADGKTVIIGATDDIDNPVLRLTLNDKEYGISMFLPGLAKSSKNVLVVHDGKHVLAIDPRKQDVWKLVPVFNKNGTADFNWWKLTHVKKGNITSCPKAELAPPRK